MTLPAEKPAGQTADAGLLGRDAVVNLVATAAISSLAMTTRNRSVILTTNSDNGIAVVLPPVAESAGMWFTIHLVARATNDVTINDDADDADFAQVTLNLTNEQVILFSDGIHWFCMDGTVPKSVS